MLRVVQLLGWPLLKVKRSFLGVFGLKMLQFFMFFFVIFSVFGLISLRWKFLKVDEGLFRDKVLFFTIFMSYMFWYYKHKHAK